MSNWINRLERKFGKYAIHNLAIYIIGAYVIGYLFEFINPGLMDAFTLNPYRIFHGEVWRIFTWVLVPPSNFGLFTIIMLFFYYSLARNLEYSWGAFRFNLYIFSGILMTVVGAILYYLISDALMTREIVKQLGGLESFGGELAALKDAYYKGMFSYFSTYYINLSIFLAFATSYPDMQVLLYFVIPIKIKWMAWLDVAILVFEMVNYVKHGVWAGVVAIVVSLLNFLIFFMSTRNVQRMSPKEVLRRRNYSRQVGGANHVVKHKCAICGRTNEDDDNLEFRFCSKCEGNYEYCQYHLFTHEHVKLK